MSTALDLMGLGTPAALASYLADKLGGGGGGGGTLSISLSPTSATISTSSGTLSISLSPTQAVISL